MFYVMRLVTKQTYDPFRKKCKSVSAVNYTLVQIN